MGKTISDYHLTPAQQAVLRKGLDFAIIDNRQKTSETVTTIYAEIHHELPNKDNVPELRRVKEQRFIETNTTRVDNINIVERPLPL